MDPGGHRGQGTGGKALLFLHEGQGSPRREKKDAPSAGEGVKGAMAISEVTQ